MDTSKEPKTIFTARHGPMEKTKPSMTAIVMAGLLALEDQLVPMPMATAHYRVNLDDDLTITVRSLNPKVPVPRGIVLSATLEILKEILGGMRFCFYEVAVV